jgi:hypothetical protein
MAAAVLGRRGNAQGRDTQRHCKVDGTFDDIGLHGISLG